MAYIKSQPLIDYLNRIDAEELSFKRFMVKEHHAGYYTEKALIRIADGKIRCSSKEYEPTEAERSAIEAALVNADFPKSIGARDVDALRQELNRDAETYEVWDRASDLIVMVQQSVRKRDGSKTYPVWSFWSDGIWRNMEPDGKLAFFKPRARTRAARLMIHEGAKAAKYVQYEIVGKGGAGHPWAEELERYEHWGMLGGALAPHRALYEEIAREGFVEIVYACDNDWPGQSAIQEVSRHYGKAMRGVRPDDRFPQSWDMADPMPKKLFVGTRWVGPSLRDLTVPATRATETMPPKDGKGRAVIMLKRSFKEEWCHCVTPEIYIHRDWPDKMYTESEFNNWTSPFSDVANTATLLKRDATMKGVILKYSPAERPGMYASAESGRFINTHVPGPIKAERGDATPWIEFLENLVPEERDRENLMRWCATLVARPEIKMLYGVLMISETQGVGKGTLGEKILSPLVGVSNTSSPSEQEIVDSNYNYWLAHKRLAVVHEIYAGHSAKAYNRLKSVITDKYVSVSKKYMANYEIENWIHVFACSNSVRAIQLSSEDRRWFIPRVTEKKKAPRYWSEFFEWLNERGGLQIIRWWAEEHVKTPENIVSRGEDAPWSTLKRSVIDEGKSITERFVTELTREIVETLRGEDEDSMARREAWRQGGYLLDEEAGVFVLDVDIQTLIRNKFYDGRYDERLLRLSTIRKAADGMFSSEQIKGLKSWMGDGYGLCKMLCTSKSTAGMRPSEIRQRPLGTSILEKM